MIRIKKIAKDPSPVVSRREQKLLDELNLFKKEKRPTTVNGFCRHVGYANKSALRHFPVFRRELSLYAAQFTGPGQKRQTPSTAKYYEVQIERLNLQVDRLKLKIKTIPHLKQRTAKLEKQAKEDSDQKRRLRGMLSTVIAFLSGSDFAKARDLSERLEKQAEKLINDDQATDDD